MSIAKGRKARLCSWGVLVVLASLAPLALAQGGSVAELRRTAQEQPDNPAAWINLGQAQFEAGRHAEAKDAFMEAVAIDYLSADGHFGLGLVEYALGDYEAALFEFNEVSRLFPERFDGHFNRAVTLAKLRRGDAAAQAFRQALEQADPEATAADKVAAQRGLAVELKGLGRFDQAAEAYGAALALQPGDTDLTYLRAESLYRAGKGLEALPLLTQLETDSSDYRISALIADIYVEAGQIDYALRSLERAFAKAEAGGGVDAQANIVVKLGLLQRQLGRTAEAIEAFRTATRIDPTSWQALYNLGVSYMERGQSGEALRVLEEAVVRNPDKGESRLALATVYDQLGRSAEALQQAEAAVTYLQAADLKVSAQMIIGRSLFRLADYRGALNAFERVVAAQPGDADGQLWAGLAAYQLGTFETAIRFFERAVQLEPGNAEARVNLGAAYLASQRYGDAELVYQLVVRENPGNAEAHYNLGWALFSQGRRDQARQAWQSAVGLDYEPAQQALSRYF